MKFTIDHQQMELALSLFNASLEIKETEDEVAELEFEGLRRKTAEAFFKVSFYKNRLVIKEKSERNSPILESILSGDLSKKLILKIPIGTNLSGSVSTLRGDMVLGDLKFSGSLKTITGNLSIKKMVSDDLQLQNISGKTNFACFKGSLKAKTMTGPFHIEDGMFSEIGVKGVSGDIYLAGGFELDGENEISSLSGNINVAVHRFKGEGVLILSSMGGNPVVHGSYPEESIEIRKRMPFIKSHPLKSFFPGIKDYFSSIYSSSHQDDEVEVEVTSEKEDDNIKLILQMLSEGKITAEEAEKLIKALGSGHAED